MNFKMFRVEKSSAKAEVVDLVLEWACHEQLPGLRDGASLRGVSLLRCARCAVVSTSSPSAPNSLSSPYACLCSPVLSNWLNNATLFTGDAMLRRFVFQPALPFCALPLTPLNSLSLSTRRSSPHLFPLALVFFTTLHAQPPSLFSHSSFQRCTCPPSHAPVFYSSFLSVARSASRTLLCCFVLFLALFPMKCESQAAVRCLKMLRRARPWASSASAVRITAPFAAKRAVIRRAIS